MVFPKHRTVVFVHGCFWHRHRNCRYTANPSTRPEFWRTKFQANMARDRLVRSLLLGDGWRIATVWECALRKPEQLQAATDALTAWISGAAAELELGEKEVAKTSDKSP